MVKSCELHVKLVPMVSMCDLSVEDWVTIYNALGAYRDKTVDLNWQEEADAAERIRELIRDRMGLRPLV